MNILSNFQEFLDEEDYSSKKFIVANYRNLQKPK